MRSTWRARLAVAVTLFACVARAAADDSSDGGTCSGDGTTTCVGATVGGVVLLVLLACCCWRCCCQSRATTVVVNQQQQVVFRPAAAPMVPATQVVIHNHSIHATSRDDGCRSLSQQLLHEQHAAQAPPVYSSSPKDTYVRIAP